MAEEMRFEFAQGGYLSYGPNRDGKGHSIYCASGECGRSLFQTDPLELKKLGELLIKVANSSDLLWNGAHPVGQS